jgi:orotate phosphoribosyltransferase
MTSSGPSFLGSASSSIASSPTSKALEARVVAGFFEHGVALVNTQTPFTLASGASSPVYLDHRRVYSVPGLRDDLTSLWAARVREGLVHLLGHLSPGSAAQGDDHLGVVPPLADVVVAGTATAGIAPAYALASALGARFAYVRAKPKAHGLGRLVEGVWNGGEACIVVDDMVTTGGSLLEAAAALRAEGARVLFATSITRHAFSATQARFAAAGLALESCFTSRSLFTLAAEGGFLSTADLATVLAWLDLNDRGDRGDHGA